MEKFVVALDKLYDNNVPVSEAGGKAYSLGVLSKKGYPIPPGFVLTSSLFAEYLRHNGLSRELQQLSSEITEENSREKSDRAKKLILSGNLPPYMLSQLGAAIDQLRRNRVSVRSSAVSEDSSKLSFAGLLDTFLNIPPEFPVLGAHIKKCWASVFNDNVVAYRIRKEVPHSEGMAVIVQEMIPSEISGITFSVHPLSNDAILIEASYGVGELIVSGRIDPDDFILSRTTLQVLQKKIGNKCQMAVCGTEKTNVVRVAEQEAKRESLSDERLKEIAAVCLRIEKDFSCPQDIEWCIEQNTLWVLQSRPITIVTRPGNGTLCEK